MGIELHRLRDREFVEIALNTTTEECFIFHGIEQLKEEVEKRYPHTQFKERFSKQELKDWIENNIELYDDEDERQNLKFIEEIFK